MGVHDGHRGRLRERYINEGGKCFAAHNLLELLLFYGIPRKDTSPIAHALLERFGNVNDVLNATVEELCQVNGVNESTAVLIHLVGEMGDRFYRNEAADELRFFTYDEIGLFLYEQFTDKKQEQVLAMYTTNSGKLLKLDTLCVGGVNSASFDVRKLVATAISVDAGAVILAHNHPGGTCIPTGEDLDTTKNIGKVLSSAGIELVEHYVIAEDGCCRIMEELYEEPAQLRQQYALNIGKSLKAQGLFNGNKVK